MDDDLDAFFDDVENAVKEVQETAEDQNEGGLINAAAAGAEEEHPPKRPKLDAVAAATPSAPVKAVVASSVPVISIAPPLPAGPPPVAYLAASAPPSSGNGNIPPPPPNSSYPGANGDGASQPAMQHPPPPPPAVNPNAKPHVRSAAGQTWSDPTLAQWPENDFRLFVGNLAKDLKQHHLEQHFGRYPSFAMARIMYNKADGKSRGYGFVSLLDPKDCAKAIREMDQSWLGSRPIKVKLSEWKEREWKEAKKRGKAEKRKKKRFMGS
eukprot:CAMPEP_0172527908 /NCGR_PEP_ID=MMETSP1067-20121228/2452_1 /TAXON_ID=265564 ORGANISM="Thalassiosira punctigera, Strain Tpunct2005C2" /NCGR_SAMPLE_ID=MMETSP1067 /ASSEMBLY_ACC=CAM_ASM_000444 /LENGTH=266 /DNA_ID=CAMNT_0013311733 /DNA_START=38 /DNA_END=838 /DNA_ORIENTATION=+